MANALYNKYKQACLDGSLDLSTLDIRAILIDTADYTFAATHEFLSEVAAASREEVSDALASKTIVDGVFDAADKTFSGTAGDACEAILLYRHTGTDATSELICYIDTGAGLPVTLGGDVTVRWDATGIFII